MVKNERIYSFKELEEMLNNKESVKLAFNTVAHRINDNKIGIRLHNTDVVIVNRNNTYSLYTGNWHSVTTKSRLNGFSPAHVQQIKGVWYASGSEFCEGITVNEHGEVIPQF